jgi:hypothetical protein
MTSEEYAEMVKQTIMRARTDSGEEDVRVLWAYKDLADGSHKRCLGIGRRQYEVDPNRQAFEDRPVWDALVEARQEVLDIPAYLVQAEHLADAPIRLQVQHGIAVAVQLLLILDRIAETISEADNG